jgi:hypothetical protein
MLFKVDLKGNIVWNQEFYGLGSATCNDIISNGSGGYLISGGTIDASGLSYAWLLNTDVNGNKIRESSTPMNGFTGWISGAIPNAKGFGLGLNMIPSNTAFQDHFGLIFTDQNGKIIEHSK